MKYVCLFNYGGYDFTNGKVVYLKKNDVVKVKIGENGDEKYYIYYEEDRYFWIDEENLLIHFDSLANIRNRQIDEILFED